MGSSWDVVLAMVFFLEQGKDDRGEECKSLELFISSALCMDVYSYVCLLIDASRHYLPVSSTSCTMEVTALVYTLSN